MSDRERSGGHGIRPTIAEISSDDDDDGLFVDRLSDAGTESGDEAVDEAVSEDGDGGESTGTSLEWKIDHSSGDHGLNGMLAGTYPRWDALTMCSTGFHHEELNQLNLTACKPSNCFIDYTRSTTAVGRLDRQRLMQRTHISPSSTSTISASSGSS